MNATTENKETVGQAPEPATIIANQPSSPNSNPPQTRDNDHDTLPKPEPNPSDYHPAWC